MRMINIELKRVTVTHTLAWEVAEGNSMKDNERVWKPRCALYKRKKNDVRSEVAQWVLGWTAKKNLR